MATTTHEWHAFSGGLAGSNYDRPHRVPRQAVRPRVALPVEKLLELLSSGMTIDEILADYADLEREDLLAVLASCHL